MKNYTHLAVIVFLCFAMCKKEDISENLCYSPTLISQINSGDIAVHGLTYNSNCLVYESTEPYVYKRFTYDDNDLLKKVEMAYSFSAFSCSMIPGQSLEVDPRKATITQYSEYEYDGAFRIAKKLNYFINNGISQLTSWQTYDYANDNIVKLSTFNPQGNLTSYHDFTYDKNGNLIKDELYTNNTVAKLVTTLLYNFDNKNNPYKVFACEGTPGRYTNRNNIVQETYISYYGTAESSTKTLYEYKYNRLDYPVRINELDCLYGK